MNHGTQCNCMMCTVGKKIGMIRSDQHDHGEHHNDANRNICKNCGHSHKSDGTCDCGCK